jgi:DNA-binding PadR family transcriptional regulator
VRREAKDTDGHRDPRLLLLVSLASGPKHGYAMMEDVEGFASVRLGPGTLYGALSRLERDGLVEPIESADRKRPYRLTDAGERGLRAQLEGISSIVQLGRRRLSAP